MDGELNDALLNGVCLLLFSFWNTSCSLILSRLGRLGSLYKGNQMKTMISQILLLALLSAFSQVEGQAVPDTTFNLSSLAMGEGWAIFNRSVTIAEDGQNAGIYLDEKAGQGVAWLPSFKIGNGVIEVDVKGRNVLGRSFVGLAFCGVNAENYEAVYLRPFNFRAESETSRSHAVQYVVVPSHEWRRLRTEHSGQYEAAIPSPPAPDAWVHLSLELNGPTLRVFIDRAPEPALVIDRISAVEKGWIGLWVGHGSDGAFANLRVRSE
jgi:hypothetical protein